MRLETPAEVRRTMWIFTTTKGRRIRDWPEHRDREAWKRHAERAEGGEKERGGWFLNGKRLHDVESVTLEGDPVAVERKNGPRRVSDISGLTWSCSFSDDVIK